MSLIKQLFAGILAVLAAVSAGGTGIPEELESGLYAEFKTSKGSMVFELDYTNTPLTVAGFAGLAAGILENDRKPYQTPYFDDMEVTYTVPRYAIFIGQKEPGNHHSLALPREVNQHISAGDSGVLLMDGISAELSGNRYFITLSGDPFLDSQYTSFGRIVRGEKVLKKLREGDTVKSVEILQIGEEAESLSLNQEIFTKLISSGREAEKKSLESINPELAKAVRDLGDESRKSISGIYYTVIQEGSGDFPETGDQVSINYTGSLLDGNVFDSSINRGQTFDIILGQDLIIPGWIEMVSGMRSGEQRRVIIPPQMAYGETSYGPIKPNSWLIFDMELVSIAKL